MTDVTPTPLQLTIHPLPDTIEAPAKAATFWSGDAPSFKDVLDIINPLEHIPIVSTIYQAVTGETQSMGSKIAGGALFGGPIGLLSAIFDGIVQSATGNDIAGNVMAAIEGKPVPALQQFADASSDVPLGANQRASYNAYVHAGMLS